MACVALASLMATIHLEFLNPNHRVSVDDEKPLKSLFQNLSSLQTFLQKEPNNGGAPTRHLEIKIRDFALQAEDAIELQLSTILLPKDTACGGLQQTLREVAEDAQELLKMVNNKGSEAQAARDAHHPGNVVLGGRSSPCSPNLEDHFNEDAFRAASERLLNLARRVYASKEARSYIRAWVTVPREYNLRHVLLDLLQSMTPTIKNINKGSTLSQLKDEVHKHLRGKEKMYFIVLDNIPNTQAWDDINTCLPQNSKQISILLTTQIYIVGHNASACLVHEMCALDSDRSWKLFRKRLSLREHIPPKFEAIGKRVVEECQVLPRSIVAVAERLSKCDCTLEEWKRIEKEVETLGPLYNDTEHLSKLTLIYNQLPQHLKVLFLHFAIYPKGFRINVKRLIRIWIAEGFVGNGDLEKEAYLYLQQLATNGVVSISNWEHKMTNVCWMHSSLRDFCVREAKKGGLLCAVNTQNLGMSLDMFANSCRWLSLYLHRLDYYTLFSSNNPRSLFFFQGDSKALVSFKLLRILDLSALGVFERVPLLLRGLVFLRYLSIPQCFEGLDDVVSNNRNLQTLIVSGIEPQLRTPTRHLASRIWESPHLRHLELRNFYTADPPSVVKEQLQTLSWVSPTHFTKKVYCNFPNINYLKVYYKNTFEPRSTLGFCRNPTINLDYIKYLSKLETLTVIVPGGCATHLEQPVFPAKLKKLRLSGTNLPMKVLRGIEQLPMLKVLKLENALKMSGVWKQTARFNSLKVLLVEAKNLMKWEAHSYYFPKLKKLVLRRCDRLDEIPFEFESIDSLQTIEVEQCRAPGVVTSAIRIQKKRKDIYAVLVQNKRRDYRTTTRTIQKSRDISALKLITVVVDGIIHH